MPWKSVKRRFPLKEANKNLKCQERKKEGKEVSRPPCDLGEGCSE
jgi:hypothetical protein